MDSIALIAPKVNGGVAYIIERLWEGLRRERLPVSKIVVSGSPTLFHLNTALDLGYNNRQVLN